MFSLKPLAFLLLLAFVLLDLTSAATFKSRCTTAHNKLRKEHQASGLIWSAGMASKAQAHANKCVFKHSGAGYGENIAMGYDTPEKATQAWVRERNSYNYSSPGFTMTTGHFTQVVWRSTTHVGCGWKACSQGKFYVCMYNNPGNYAGQFPANVKPKKTS